MNSSLFFRTKNVFRRSWFPIIGVAVFLVSLFAVTTAAHADDTYNGFLYLFNTKQSPTQLDFGNNTHTFTRKSWVTVGNDTDGAVVGIDMVFSYRFFDSTNPNPDVTSVPESEIGNNPKYSWDHIKDNSNAFMVRSCDTGGTTNCIYSSVPYENTTFSFNSMAELLNKESKTIYRKTSNRGTQYASGQSVDTLNTSWKTIDGNSISDVDFLKKNPQDISIWYCGSKFTYGVAPWGSAGMTEEVLRQALSQNNPNIQQFGSRCDGLPYFKIGEVTNLKPSSYIEAAAEFKQAAPESSDSFQTTQNLLPECSITNGALGSGSWAGCLAQLAYHLIYQPIAWFAGIMGKLFDFFLGYSLDDSSYRAGFAVQGWQLVRDISNIFFILILVWTGFSTALGFGKVSIKSVLPILIVNALLINFSLFGTRLVIDLSNIVSRVFYNQVEVCQGTCQYANGKIINPRTDTVGYKPLSDKIVSAFNPQKLFAQNVLQSQNVHPAAGSNAAGLGQTDHPSSRQIAGYFIVVCLVASAILFAIAKMFWSTAFLFLGRVVQLYISMIFAPFAVLTFGGMPLVGGIDGIAWGSWKKDLIKSALLAPIFVFFLFIIYSFITSDFLKVTTDKLTGSGDFFQTVIGVCIPLLIVYFMIKKGVGIANTYATGISEGINGWINNVVGGAGSLALGGAGLAAGGAAILGRNTLGRAARWGTNRKTGAKVKDANGNEVDETYGMRWAANAANSRYARFMNNASRRMQTGTWDARNISSKVGGKEYSLGKTLAKGIGFFDKGAKDKISGTLGLTEGAGKGGILAADKEAAKRKQEARDAKIGYDHLSDDQASAVWTMLKERAAQKAGEERWEDFVSETDEIKPFAKREKELKEELKKKEDALKEAKEKGTTYEQAVAETAYTNAKKAHETATKEFAEKRAEFIKDIRETKNDKARAEKKAQAVAAAEKDELLRLNKYGKIKDVKSLQIAMRAEYAKSLQDKFIWGRDKGTNIFNMFAGGGMAGLAAGALAAMIPIIGPAIAPALGTAIGTAVAGRLKDQKGIIEKSLKASVDAATKGSGAKSKIGKAVEALDKINDQILKMVNDQLKTSYKAFDDIKNDDEIDLALEGHKLDLEKEITKKQAEAADASKTPEERRMAQMEANRIRTRMKNIDKILENQKKAQEAFDKLKKEEKDAEEKKK